MVGVVPLAEALQYKSPPVVFVLIRTLSPTLTIPPFWLKVGASALGMMTPGANGVTVKFLHTDGVELPLVATVIAQTVVLENNESGVLSHFVLRLEGSEPSFV